MDLAEELLTSAVEAAQLGGRILVERFEGPRTVELKGAVDLVTDADRASEEAIVGLLRGRYPDHDILAEEGGLTRAAGAYRWIVDPLDGTTNYAHGLPFFCVSVAVERVSPDGTGELLAGAVLDPLRGELFSAAKGRGATVNGRRLEVSRARALSEALLCTGFPYDLHAHPEVPLGLFNQLVLKARGMRRLGSAALDLAFLAAGRLDGFFELGLKPWDIAAGALLVEEAGGVVRRIDGARLDLAVGHIYAAPPALAPAIEAECKELFSRLGWTPKAPRRP